MNQKPNPLFVHLCHLIDSSLAELLHSGTVVDYVTLGPAEMLLLEQSRPGPVKPDDLFFGVNVRIRPQPGPGVTYHTGPVPEMVPVKEGFYSFDGESMEYHDTADEASGRAEKAVQREEDHAADSDWVWRDSIDLISWGRVQQRCQVNDRNLTPDEKQEHPEWGFIRSVDMLEVPGPSPEPGLVPKTETSDAGFRKWFENSGINPRSVPLSLAIYWAKMGWEGAKSATAGVWTGDKPRTGADAIADERLRQIEVEGRTVENDVLVNDAGELMDVAVHYVEASIRKHDGETGWADLPIYFPWPRQWWKPSAEIQRNLEKAGALLAAEWDRLEALKMEAFLKPLREDPTAFVINHPEPEAGA